MSNLDRRETRRYLEMFYALKFRKLVSFFVHPTCQFSRTIHWCWFFDYDIIHLCDVFFQAESVPRAVED